MRHLEQDWPSARPATDFIRLAMRIGALLSLWAARVRQRSELAHLDERLRADIGVTRLQAEREISKPFWQ
ncbi:MAG TPA: DUF1127 domain-containing protein [Pseudolabrys sp.]|nr:DUF1127 domain-containing protein [Pseudolabrys sp.]